MRGALFSGFVSGLVVLYAAPYYSADADAQPKPESALPAPGTVLNETSQSIAHGFRQVARSQVNAPGHFEGIGHFIFVYYKNEQLCQCGKDEIAISPDGQYAIFTDVSSGKLLLFTSASRARKELTQKFAGYPKSASWDLAAKQVVVTLEKYENGVGSINTLTVRL
jgi:hypothetical protein